MTSLKKQGLPSCSLLLALLISLPWTTPACSGTSNPDAGLDDGGDGNDGQEGDDDTVARTLVEGTQGYCNTTGPVDAACQVDADCVGYLRPVAISCGLGVDEWKTIDMGCGFARRSTFPTEPDCSADALCEDVPRACVDGVCAFVEPDRACAADADCEVAEYGCACLARAVTDTDFAPVFEHDCAGRTACQPDAEAVCLDGRCHLVGAFMNEIIAQYCELAPTCNSPNTVAECVTIMTADGWQQAALLWPIIRLSHLADTCGPLFSGPWNELL